MYENTEEKRNEVLEKIENINLTAKIASMLLLDLSEKFADGADCKVEYEDFRIIEYIFNDKKLSFCTVIGDKCVKVCCLYSNSNKILFYLDGSSIAEITINKNNTEEDNDLIVKLFDMLISDKDDRCKIFVSQNKGEIKFDIISELEKQHKNLVSNPDLFYRGYEIGTDTNKFIDSINGVISSHFESKNEPVPLINVDPACYACKLDFNGKPVSLLYITKICMDTKNTKYSGLGIESTSRPMISLDNSLGRIFFRVKKENLSDWNTLFEFLSESEFLKEEIDEVHRDINEYFKS